MAKEAEIFDLPDGTSLRVEKLSDGTYYAAGCKFDFTAASEKEMNERLCDMEAELVGWEKN